MVVTWYKGVTYNQITGEKPLCCIPLHEIHAVERVDEDAFGMKFVCYALSTWWLLSWYTCIDDASSARRWQDIILKGKEYCRTNGMVWEKLSHKFY